MINRPEAQPLLVIPAFREVHIGGETGLLPKGLVSSLTRSQFGGITRVFSNVEAPLFKIGRQHVEEVVVDNVTEG